MIEGWIFSLFIFPSSHCIVYISESIVSFVPFLHSTVILVVGFFSISILFRIYSFTPFCLLAKSVTVNFLLPFSFFHSNIIFVFSSRLMKVFVVK